MKRTLIAYVSLACLLLFSYVNGQEKVRVEKDLLCQSFFFDGDPHDHLNRSRSTNDSHPTAITLAFLLRNDKPIDELQRLAVSFRLKGDAFLGIVKMGRTEMRDAVPLTVGQEVHAFAASLEAEIQLLRDAENYPYSELMNIVAFRVMGNDYSVCLAAHSAQLQLNAYEPLEGLAVLESKALLYSTSSPFPSRYIDGITVDEKTLNHYMETMVGIVTALNPVLGYEKATELTCDPVAGYVQVPRIERCAYGAVKAWIGYSIASEEIPDQRRVDLGTAIAAMALTAKDMNTRYKETSEGGLAVSVVLC
jgi:hypothetical protein